jgi:hypothetical protein
MKIFGFKISRDSAAPQQHGKYSIMNGMIFPNGDLSKPFINEQYKGSGGYVLFGQDNLYPQMLASLYYISPLHHAITNFKRNAVSGQGVDCVFSGDTASEKVEQARVQLFIKKNLKLITLDLILHARIYLKLSFNKDGKMVQAHRIDPVMVRHDAADMYGRVTRAFINRDWTYATHTEVLPVYEPGKKYTTDVIYMYQEPSTGVLTYSLPGYASAANWMFLDGEVSYLHKSNILNSINPSFILNFPKMPANKQEMERIKDMLEQKGQGAKNAGRAITLFSQTRDQMPDIVTAPSSQNDKLFMQTSKDLRDSICFSHEVNPSIIGIKVAGSLGNAQELTASWSLFDANVVRPLRETLEVYFTGLIDIADLSGVCNIKPTEITFS